MSKRCAIVSLALVFFILIARDFYLKNVDNERIEKIKSFKSELRSSLELQKAELKISSFSAAENDQISEERNSFKIALENQEPEKAPEPAENSETARDPLTHCKPGQRYSDVKHFINQNWELNLSREKLTGEQMHEILIHKMSFEEKEDWICKTFGERLEEQENKEEKVAIAWFYQNGRNYEKPFKSTIFKEDNEEYGEKGYGHKVCGNCVFTNDRDAADALIIQNTILRKYQKDYGITVSSNSTNNRFLQNEKTRKNFPDFENRNQSQFWVFVNYESGAKNIENQSWMMPPLWDASFNITYSYKRDSDIVRGYGSVQNILRDFYYDYKTGESLGLSREEHLEKIINWKNSLKGSSKKNLHTAWFVSNCDHTIGAVKRWEQGKKMIEAGLGKHLLGEGKCFDGPTNRAFSQNDIRNSKWTKMRFYLAFENAIHCTDYISEKFWRNSLTATLVPVVFGPHYLDVAKVAPPNSFIHAEQFADPADLVFYMNYLWKNDTAYMDYHRWRSLRPDSVTPRGASYRAIDRDMYDWCRICRLVREKRAEKVSRWYKSVMKFWRYDVHDECKAKASYPERIKNIEENLVEIPLS